ncbi:MAG: hypothetical protein JNL08_12545 [Planctomycetes bacterium]|nr:hypothetical protein [Planctomycetota bacterium]
MVVTLAVATAPAPAQARRLVDCVEAPIAYVRLDAAAGADAAAPLRQLIADPGLDAVVARDQGPLASAWGLVRGMLTRNCGEVELALTGIVPGAGRPLLLLRVELPAAEAERLQARLQQGTMASAHRSLGGHATWRLAAAGAEAPAPGELVELTVVGSDLLVGNDDLGMQELLAPVAPRTSAGPRRVLAEDPGFRAMRERLAVPPGSLLAFGDWQRLGPGLQQAIAGVPGALLDRSGLGGARRVMLSLAPDQTAFAATMLLSFEAPEAADAVDGWLAAAQNVPARQLASELPGADLGGVVVAVDLAALASRTHRGEHVLHDLRHSFEDYGLDFDRNVLGRLGGLGTVQLLLRDGGEGAAAEVAAVYALRARSKAAAADLFVDLRRAAEAHGIGQLVAAKDRRGPDVLELRPRREPSPEPQPPICVAVVEDAVLVAFDAATLRSVHDDYRRSARNRGRRDAVVGSAVQRIGGAAVAGLFDLDLQGLFARLLPPAAGRDLSGIPSRHIGCLSLEPRPEGSFVRVCVLSSR